MTSASTYSETGEKGKPISNPSSASDSPPQKTPAEIYNLPEKQPPLSGACWLHGSKLGQGQVWVITNQTALAQINAHARSNLTSELGGALLGRAYRHQKTVFVEILAAIPVVSSDHGPIHFTFTADSWPQIQRDRNEHYPNLEIVGWFHTHPGLGVFYSSDDVVVHSAAFTLPWHVGLVVDPIRHEACFFGWVQGALAPLTGFYELLGEGQSQPSVDWRVVRTSVWENVPERELYASSETVSSHPPQRQPMVAMPPGPDQLALSYSWLGLGVGAAALVLSLFLLFGWVWPLNQRVNYLENLALVLADETMLENQMSCPDPNLRILSPAANSQIRKGAVLSVIGTANHAQTNRYRISIRSGSDEGWTTVGELRRDTSLGQLAEWSTEVYEPTLYQLRLQAVDNNNFPIENQTICIIPIQLVP